MMRYDSPGYRKNELEETPYPIPKYSNLFRECFIKLLRLYVHGTPEMSFRTGCTYHEDRRDDNRVPGRFLQYDFIR